MQLSHAGPCGPMAESVSMIPEDVFTEAVGNGWEQCHHLFKFETVQAKSTDLCLFSVSRKDSESGYQHNLQTPKVSKYHSSGVRRSCCTYNPARACQGISQGWNLQSPPSSTLLFPMSFFASADKHHLRKNPMPGVGISKLIRLCCCQDLAHSFFDKKKCHGSSQMIWKDLSVLCTVGVSRVFL